MIFRMFLGVLKTMTDDDGTNDQEDNDHQDQEEEYNEDNDLEDVDDGFGFVLKAIHLKTDNGSR